MMRTLVAALFVLSVVAGLPVSGAGQAPLVGDMFREGVSSVAVIPATGSEVSARTGGVSRFKETGSGLLISADGRIMTTAHVVHAMIDSLSPNTSFRIKLLRAGSVLYHDPRAVRALTWIGRA